MVFLFTKRSVNMNLIKWITLRFLQLYFDNSRLSGPWFEEALSGYKWAIQAIWTRNILKLGRRYPYPVHLTCYVSNPSNLIFANSELHNLQSRGTYYQCLNGKIFLGKGVYIAPNVGLITQNHKLGSLTEHDEPEDIIIGDHCWIGMNSIILPGVTLGRGVTVAAGSIVTKSFHQNDIVIAGNPARIIKENSNG